MKEQKEDTLFQFLQTCLEPFTIEHLLRYLGEGVSPAAIEDLADYLSYNQIAYRTPAFDENDEFWLSRAGLFTGKVQVIVPEADEIASGILIPGSRFLPFYNPLVLPHELILRFQGVPLPRKIMDCDPDELYIPYQYFGEEYVSQFISDESEENAQLFNNSEFDDPLEISISVFDLSSVYFKSSFKPGDRLVVKLSDWVDGVFDLSVLSAAQVDAEKERAWVADFTECLGHSFQIAGPCATIEEQLAFAYFLGNDTLFSPYSPGLDGFIASSKDIGFELYGVETRLWFAGKTIPALGSWNIGVIADPASLLEEAMAQLALPASVPVLDAYVLDSLWRKETDPVALMQRLFPSTRRKNEYCIPVVERYIYTQVVELGKTYNWFADRELGALRNRFVELHTHIARFLIEMAQSGFRPDQIPEQGAVILAQMMSHTITSLENITLDEVVGTELESLWVSLEGMEDTFFDTRAFIQEVLPEMQKNRLNVLRQGKEEEDESDE